MRNGLLRLVFALTLALAGLAGLPAQAQGPAHEPEATGLVKVTVQAKGEADALVPVEGATVILRDTTRTTGADGTCSFEGVKLGQAVVVAKKDGYKDAQARIDVVAPTDELPAVQVTITLEPIPAEDESFTGIRGTVRILGPNGGPVVGAVVEYSGEGEDNTGSASTDESGKFAFPDLAPGKYTLTVKPAEPADPPTPGTVDFEPLSRDVTLGEEGLTVNFVVEQTNNGQPKPTDQVGKIDVTVTDAEGNLLADVVLRARNVTAVTGAEGEALGKASLENVVAGEVTLFAALKGYHPLKTGVALAAGETQTVQLTLVALSPTDPKAPGTGTISGVVTDQKTGEPVVGAYVVLGDPADEAGVEEPAEEVPLVTGEDGSYQLLDVPAGLVHITILADGYRKSHKRVRLRAGDALENVNFALHARAPEEEGQVQKEREKGDISGTGKLGIGEVLKVLRGIVLGGIEDLIDVADVAPRHENGDVGNGRVDVADVLRLLREMLGQEPVFP